jgi:hypothetical protein
LVTEIASEIDVTLPFVHPQQERTRKIFLTSFVLPLMAVTLSLN